VRRAVRCAPETLGEAMQQLVATPQASMVARGPVGQRSGGVAVAMCW
jgi:hypothetical protein